MLILPSVWSAPSSPGVAEVPNFFYLVIFAYSIFYIAAMVAYRYSIIYESFLRFGALASAVSGLCLMFMSMEYFSSL